MTRNAQYGTALKKYTNTDAFECFLREVACMKALSHPFICKIVSVDFKIDARLELTTNLYDGDLKSCYANNAPPRHVLGRIAHCLWNAVSYMHSVGMWHRDIKGANVLVKGPTRTIPHVALNDFNTAALYIPGRNHTLCPTTHWYAAPEMLLGSVTYDTSVDTWSLGVTLFELASGQYLFPCNSKEAVDTAKIVFDTIGHPSSEEEMSIYESLLQDKNEVSPPSSYRSYGLDFAAANMPQKYETFVRSALRLTGRAPCFEFMKNGVRRRDEQHGKRGKHFMAPHCDWKSAWDEADHLNQKIRSICLDWVAEVGAFSNYSMPRETVYMSASILDVYILNHPLTTRKLLQACACASLHLASSLLDKYSTTLEDLVFLSADTYTQVELASIVERMAHCIGFNVYRQTDNETRNQIDESWEKHALQRRKKSKTSDMDASNSKLLA